MVRGASGVLSTAPPRCGEVLVSRTATIDVSDGCGFFILKPNMVIRDGGKSIGARMVAGNVAESTLAWRKCHS